MELNIKPPTWSYTLGPPSTEGQIVYNVHIAPNRFHRWMQKVCLGIYWEPIPANKEK